MKHTHKTLLGYLLVQLILSCETSIGYLPVQRKLVHGTVLAYVPVHIGFNLMAERMYITGRNLDGIVLEALVLLVDTLKDL